MDVRTWPFYGGGCAGQVIPPPPTYYLGGWRFLWSRRGSPSPPHLLVPPSNPPRGGFARCMEPYSRHSRRGSPGGRHCRVFCQGPMPELQTAMHACRSPRRTYLSFGERRANKNLKLGCGPRGVRHCEADALMAPAQPGPSDACWAAPPPARHRQTGTTPRRPVPWAQNPPAGRPTARSAG